MARSGWELSITKPHRFDPFAMPLHDGTDLSKRRRGCLKKALRHSLRLLLLDLIGRGQFRAGQYGALV